MFCVLVILEWTGQPRVMLQQLTGLEQGCAGLCRSVGYRRPESWGLGRGRTKEGSWHAWKAEQGACFALFANVVTMSINVTVDLVFLEVRVFHAVTLCSHVACSLFLDIL